METEPVGPSNPGPRENPPRTLYGTRVVLEESPGTVRLTLPAGGLAPLLFGIAWVGLLAWGARDRAAEGVPSWILLLAGLPGLFLSLVGLARLGRSISFELDSDRFVARGLGLLAGTTRSWNRADIAGFTVRDTSGVVEGSSGRMRLVRLLVHLRSGEEVVLIRQGDGLALGHVAVFLSKGLKGGSPEDPTPPGG